MPQSAQLTKFANERVRPSADAAESLYNTALRFISEYDSYGVSAMISDMANTDIILDGSVADGRKPLSVKDTKQMRDFMVVIKAWYETTNASVGNRTPLSLVVGSSVNGQSKF